MDRRVGLFRAGPRRFPIRAVRFHPKHFPTAQRESILFVQLVHYNRISANEMLQEVVEDMANRIGGRHIHLDFHTSELIGGVASKFDPDAFAETLKRAHVDSVTLFSRCHHGMLYYDSKLFPESVHPHLCDRKLLEHQAEACHRRGIDVNLYTTVCWDKRVADSHPEWICIDEDGALQDYKKAKYFEAGFYKNLCRQHRIPRFSEGAIRGGHPDDSRGRRLV